MTDTRVHSTPRRTKSAPSSATDGPEEEMKAPGCPWVMASGVIGLSKSLTVYDADCAVGDAQRDLSDKQRAALANYMIDLWTRFRDENSAANSVSSAEAKEVQSRRDALVVQFFDVEGDVRDLCRAVKVVSSVITDQLADPIGGPPVTSDYGLEVQTFRIDASMLRFAVDHAAELALSVSRKMQ